MKASGLPWLHIKREIHFSSSWREEKAEAQDPDLILRVELREDYILNPHPG